MPDALTMCGERIDLGRITAPRYVYASRDDHIVPWRSAYRTTALLGGEPTFVLGASGHIAGVVNPPAKGRRNYWTNDLLTDTARRLARARELACRQLVAALGRMAARPRRRDARRRPPLAATQHTARSGPRRDATCWSRPDGERQRGCDARSHATF